MIKLKKKKHQSNHYFLFLILENIITFLLLDFLSVFLSGTASSFSIMKDKVGVKG